MVALFGGTALYLLQHVRMAPNQVDGGMLFEYVARVAAGQRPFIDFIDVYGLWTWPPLAAGYRLLGDRALGARLALWAIKLAGLALNFAAVRRHAGQAYAVWATIGLCVLLGVPWQLAQDPYPYAQALACELACLYLLLPGERGRSQRREHAAQGPWPLWLAGAATAVALLTKLNTGLFLLTATCLHCAYAHGEAPRWGQPWARAAGLGGLTIVMLGACAVVRAHLDSSFVLYLLVPLGVLALQLATRPETGPSTRRLIALGHYLTAALVGTAGGLVLSLGTGHLREYLAFQGALLARLHYAASPLPFGVPGVFIGFNEHGWTRLPWLLTALYAGYAWQTRARAASAADRAARTAFGLFALHQFVIFSRADEAHVYQALLLVPAAAALTLHALSRALESAAARNAPWPGRIGAVLVCACWLDLGSADLQAIAQTGDWGGPRMRGINYRPATNPYVRPAITHMTERQEDAGVDQAARVMRARLRPGDVVLALNRNTLVEFAAGATPAGGRHAYLLYLLRNGFLSRADFEALTPPGLVQRIRHEFPAMLVGSIGGTELERAVPGMDLWLLHYYRLIGMFGPLLIYERKPGM